MWKEFDHIEEDIKQAFFKTLINRVPEGSLLAIVGLYYGSIPENTVKKYFEKVEANSWSYSHLADANYFTLLSSSKKSALSKFVDQEPNLNYELTHFFVLHEGKLIFESYDNFATNNCYSNFFNKSDLHYFQDNGMKIDTNTE